MKLGIPMSDCLQQKDRHSSVLQCWCRQACVLDVHGRHKMKCMSNGQIGGHHFIGDAVTDLAKLVCVECTDD